ncbi:hypothetical protein DL93DRAFT_2170706 [Clavulina sp. PMI_390]|nr:hypothetical protein DL93DRAFT_2170706 [Clavulina sp. PMI_390]
MLSHPSSPNLPIELVLSILEVLHADERRVGTKKPSLIQAAEVSRAWAPIAQALLYRDVAILTLRQAIMFVNVVKERGEKTAWLRSLVKNFEIIVSDEEDGRVITQSMFAHIYAMLPNVDELRLFYYCLRQLDKSTIDILRNVRAPRALSLRCAQDPSPLWDILTVFPTIQHLELISWETPPTTHQTALPPAHLAWAPYELRLLDESDGGERLSLALQRLAGEKARGQLKVLQVLSMPEEEGVFEALMKTHGPFLRSLRIKGPRAASAGLAAPVAELVVDEDSVEDADIAEALKHCSALEEFKFIGVPSKRLLASLSSSVEHLSFQGYGAQPGVMPLPAGSKGTSVSSVIDWISRGAASTSSARKAEAQAPFGSSANLRVVTYNACGSPNAEEFKKLVDVCRKRGVELRCFADTPPARESEPLTIPTRFPRFATPTPSRRPISTAPPAPAPKPLSSFTRSPSSTHLRNMARAASGSSSSTSGAKGWSSSTWKGNVLRSSENQQQQRAGGSGSWKGMDMAAGSGSGTVGRRRPRAPRQDTPQGLYAITLGL